MSNPVNPVESIEFQDGHAALYVGTAIVDGSTQADRLEVKDHMGLEDHVLVFPHNGERKVVSIRKTITIVTSSPSLPATSFGEEKLDPNPLPEKKVRKLLAIYERFTQRTY